MKKQLLFASIFILMLPCIHADDTVAPLASADTLIVYSDTSLQTSSDDSLAEYVHDDRVQAFVQMMRESTVE